MTKYLFILILLSVCGCKEEQAQETIIMNCIQNHFDDSGEGLKNALFEYQIYLKSEGFIDDNQGKDIRKYLDNLNRGEINIKDIESTFSQYLNGIERNQNFDINSCTNLIHLPNTKAKKIQEIISSMVNNPAETQPIDEFLKIVTNDDLNKNFYRFFGFIIVDYLVLFDNSGINLSEKKPKENSINRVTININIDKENKVFINSKEKSLKQIRKIVVNHIHKYGNDYSIGISINKQTTYSKYIALQNELISIINQLREEKSLDLYNVKYENLNKEKKNYIDKIVPINFNELILNK